MQAHGLEFHFFWDVLLRVCVPGEWKCVCVSFYEVRRVTEWSGLCKRGHVIILIIVNKHNYLILMFWANSKRRGKESFLCNELTSAGKLLVAN